MSSSKSVSKSVSAKSQSQNSSKSNKSTQSEKSSQLSNKNNDFSNRIVKAHKNFYKAEGEKLSPKQKEKILIEMLNKTLPNSKVSGQVQEIKNIRLALDCLNILKYGGMKYEKDNKTIDKSGEEDLPDQFDVFLKDRTFLDMMTDEFKKEVKKFEKSASLWNDRKNKTKPKTKTKIEPKNLHQKRVRPQKSESEEIILPKLVDRSERKRDMKNTEKKEIKYKEDESTSEDLPIKTPAKKRTPKEGEDGPRKREKCDGKVVVWSKEEHEAYLKAIRKHGKNWTKIQEAVGSRTQLQCQSHTAGFKVQQKKSPDKSLADVMNILNGTAVKA